MGENPIKKVQGQTNDTDHCPCTDPTGVIICNLHQVQIISKIFYAGDDHNNHSDDNTHHR